MNALAASHAGADPHGISEIKNDLGMGTAEGVADDVVDLLLAAGAHTPRALDTGIKINGDGGMGQIASGLFSSGKAGFAHTETLGCAVQRHGLSGGGSPLWQLSLRPVATGAAVAGNQAAESLWCKGVV